MHLSVCTSTCIYNELNLLGESNSTTPIPRTEISSDFNSKHCQHSEYYNYYIFVYR